MNIKNGNELIEPHGGKLINCYMTENEKDQYQTKFQDFPSYELNSYNLSDIECITTGLYSPLTGFLGEKDYKSVINSMKLINGVIWPIPVTLSATDDYIKKLDGKKKIVLKYENNVICILEISDIYKPDKKEEVQKVFLTDDENHPGVKVVFENGEYYIGGKIKVLNPIKHPDFNEYRRTPLETREYFQKKGWKTIVAFQTRNPIHRAHEYLQKVALEMVDGLLVNPLVGTTKDDDVPADVRMQSYIEVLDKYYPRDRVLLSVFPAAMRYAGPTEALMHAIARKNIGCTHFIVGRDHAGVGSYYGTYDAQKIFDLFPEEELVIVPLKFESAFFCNKCGQMGTNKTCPHGNENRIFLSGTQVRELMTNSREIPIEFTRPEVAEILRNAYKTKQSH